MDKAKKSFEDFKDVELTVDDQLKIKGGNGDEGDNGIVVEEDIVP